MVKDYAVTVSGGVLNLKFNPTVNRLALCGIEIFKASSGTIASSSFPGEEELAQATEEKLNVAALNVYPNPSNGEQIFVEATNFAQQEEVTLTLHDLVGHTLEVKTVVADENGTVTTQMAAGKQLSSGLYILKGQANSGETQTRLVIE